ncbi:MAG: hypothetical protein ACRYG2_12120 [Janthinobacterium lividum]
MLGHSLGGLLARWFVQHGGIELARLAPLVPLLPMTRAGPGQRRRPGAGRARTGAAGPASWRARATSTVSSCRTGNAGLEHPDLGVTNVDVRGIGHLSMPHHRGLAEEIADLLATGHDRPGHEGPESVTNPAEKPVRA